MVKKTWSEITKEDVIAAINIFEEECPDYPAAKNTFLIYEGKKYPAKHIRGMAYAVHFKHSIKKDKFTGGKETAEFFEKLGFEVQYKPRNNNLEKSNKDVSEEMVSNKEAEV